MKTFAIGVWVVYVLAANAMLVASAIDVETILATGPILTVAGFLFAFATRPLRSFGVLLVGLSGPLMAAFIALNIAIFRMGPGEAQRPVTGMLACYLVVFWPAALYSLVRLIQWNAPTSPPPPWLKFSLKTLLIGMTASCILLVIVRQFSEFLTPDERLGFAAFGFGVVLVCTLISWRHHAAQAAESTQATLADEGHSSIGPANPEHFP